jgi:hypothetical protein
VTGVKTVSLDIKILQLKPVSGRGWGGLFHLLLTVALHVFASISNSYDLNLMSEMFCAGVRGIRSSKFMSCTILIHKSHNALRIH